MENFQEQMPENILLIQKKELSKILQRENHLNSLIVKNLEVELLILQVQMNYGELHWT
jgi:hypothetical protein